MCTHGENHFSKPTFIRQHLSKRVAVWISLYTKLQHGIANNLRSSFIVAQHDALVKYNTFKKKNNITLKPIKHESCLRPNSTEYTLVTKWDQKQSFCYPGYLTSKSQYSRAQHKIHTLFSFHSSDYPNLLQAMTYN